jgi:HEPN domain-containing protein
MNAHDPDVAAWVRKAENDLRTIRACLQSQDPPWDAVCFHAQQAAEKFLKAFLVAHRVAPPRVHDLMKLLTLCADHDPSLSSVEPDCSVLTNFALVRYPDILEPDAATGRAAVAAAGRICDAIRQRLCSR